MTCFILTMLNVHSHKVSIDYKSHNLFNIYVAVLCSAANNNYSINSNKTIHLIIIVLKHILASNLRPVRQASEGLVRRLINKESH